MVPAIPAQNDGPPACAPSRSTPTRLLQQHLDQPRRSQPAERPLHLGGRSRGHCLERAHRQRRRLHHQRGRHRGPQTELHPECPRPWWRTSSTTPAAAAPSASPLLAFTGATFLPLVTIGSGLLLAGLALLAISSTGRRRWLHSHVRTSAVPLAPYESSHRTTEPDHDSLTSPAITSLGDTASNLVHLGHVKGRDRRVSGDARRAQAGNIA